MLTHSVTLPTRPAGLRSVWTHCSISVPTLPEEALIGVTLGSGAGWLRVTCPDCQARSVMSYNAFTSPPTV